MNILQAAIYAELICPPPGTRLDDDRVEFDWYRALADVCFTDTQWDCIQSCF